MMVLLFLTFSRAQTFAVSIAIKMLKNRWLLVGVEMIVWFFFLIFYREWEWIFIHLFYYCIEVRQNNEK